MDLGVEDRKPQPVAGEPVEVAARDPGDQPVDAQPIQVVAGPGSSSSWPSSPVIKARRLLLLLPTRPLDESLRLVDEYAALVDRYRG